ncbi:hypothetical protein, partial [Teichococcus wenyumeiae]|uniref:hypothetical protein n=1 Tax=Teichococcus wenyumeiae TaxID=2478470 RepID=UPI001F33F9EB
CRLEAAHLKARQHSIGTLGKKGIQAALTEHASNVQDRMAAVADQMELPPSNRIRGWLRLGSVELTR